MSASTTAFVLFGVGLVLWWGGFYVALGCAWRSGVRGVGVAIAGGLGVCGCFGIPTLGWMWQRMQQATFDGISGSGDADALGARFRVFKIASLLAAIGLVMQTVAGYVLPDDVDDPYGAYEDSTYEPYVDTYEEPEVDPVEREEIAPVEEDDDLLDEPVAEEELEAPEPYVEEEPAARAGSTSGVLIGMSADRRVALVLDPAGARWVRRARGAFPQMDPGLTVTAQGEPDEDVIVAPSLDDSGLDPWLAMPRPERLDPAQLGAPPDTAIGRWVILPEVRAVDATTLAPIGDAVVDLPTIRVRAPRGAIARDAIYTAVRGVLVDTRAIDPRRGGLELWVGRAEDVIAAE